MHWKSGKHERRQNFVPKDSSTTTDFENGVEECLASAVRQTIKQRAIVCGRKPLQNWSQCVRSTTECSTWRSRKSDQDSRLGAHAQNTIPNRICHRRLDKDRRIQHVQWGIQKDHLKTWKDGIVWIGRSFCENTASVLRQVLTRRTVFPHLRNTFTTFEKNRNGGQRNNVKPYQFFYIIYNIKCR